MTQVLHPKVKSRRDLLRQEKRCINGPTNGNVSSRGVVHGPPVKGGKCQRCCHIHERGPAAALAVECPTCKVQAGAQCVTVNALKRRPEGSPTYVHAARLELAAQRAAERRAIDAA